MPSLKTLYSQSFIYGLSTVLPRLLNYFLVFFHTRIFIPSEYGIITELYAYVTFFLILLTFGLETGFFRFASKKESINEVYPTSFYFLALTSTISAILFIIYSVPVSHLLGSKYSCLYIASLGLVVSIDAFTSLPFAKLRYQNRPLVFSFIKIFGVSINVLLNIIFLKIIDKHTLLSLFGTNDLILFVFIANLIQSIVVLILVLLKTGIPHFSIDKKLLKEILVYSLPLLLAGLGGTTNESFDRIFLRFLLPIDSDPQYQLGIYGSNSKLAVLLLLFIQMYRFAAEPFFFQNQKEKNSKEFFGKSFTIFLVFCLVIFLFISLNIPVFKYFVGASFREQLFIVPIMLLANILYGTFFNFSFWYKLEGKTLYGIKYTFIGAFFTIVLNVLLIPLIGIYGAALARVICYLIMNYMVYRDGLKSGFLFLEKRKIFTYSILALVIFGLSVLIFFISSILSVLVSNVMILLFIFYILKSERILLFKTVKL